MTVVLACDLGGTSFRAALVDESGHFLSEARVPGPATDDAHAASEIDAAEWWRHLVQAAEQLAREVPAIFDRAEAVAICGVTRTQVLLARDGGLLRKAFTWKDTRAGGILDALRAELPTGHPEVAHVNPFHPLARLAWLKFAEPSAFDAVARVLEPKDYLNALLTGVEATDAVSSARLLASRERGPGEEPGLLSVVGLSDTVIPGVREPWEVVGPVRAGLPGPLGRLAGIPVVCGSNDTWVGVVGLGAMRPGYCYNISGTTEVLGTIEVEPGRAEGLMTVDWRGLHQLGGPGQNGADVVAWLMQLVGAGKSSGGRLDDLLARPRHPQPVVFLPYLQGERVPYWDPHLRGAFVGLHRGHDVQDLLWAVLEGVAFLNRIVLERAEAASGRPIREIRFGGGAASNCVWAQIKADVCGRAVVTSQCRESGLLGAAIVALTALGRFPSLAAAQDSMVRILARYEPDPVRGAAYDALYAVFRETEAALAPLSRRLASSRSPSTSDPCR